MTYEIAIDARWLYSGLGTYTWNLLAGLSKLHKGVAVRAIVRKQDAERITPLCESQRIVNAPIYTLREQLEVPWAARGSDLLHVPHYNVPLFYPGRIVVTVHDLIHLTDVQTRSRMAVRAYAMIMLNAAVRRADHVITVSDFSKMQIVEHLGIRPTKITVIPNGVAPRFRPSEHQQRNGCVGNRKLNNKTYFLYVGTLKAHKNLRRLLNAVALFRMRTKLDWNLVIVGPHDDKDVEPLRNHSVRLRIADSVFFVPGVCDEELPRIYSDAQFLVLPSVVEGFGLAVAEAMACGTPVVCSRAASLPEVGGDAVLYFDPLDIEDIASALEAVATSEELRKRLREKGLQQATRFSWKESARLHAELYVRILGN